MNSRGLIPCFAWFAAALLAPLASAQVAANIIVSSGNGQLICNECADSGPFFYQQISALVTDANGNPIPNYTVNWNVVSGSGSIGGQSSFSNTTDPTGTATVTVFTPGEMFEGSNYYDATIITAQAGSLAPVTFTLTNILAYQSVSTITAYLSVQGATVPTTLSGQAGGVGAPFKVVVTGDSVVPGVSVRLINADGTSGPSPIIPSAYCQTGPGADPWSVLTDATGTATCTPVFGPVPTNGNPTQVAVEVGGLPAGEWGVVGQGTATPYNPSGVAFNPGGYGVLALPAFALSSFSINLTVTPATISSIAATSGSNQTALSGQALANPLVATVNGVSGPLSYQQVNWTANPSSAAQFTSETTTSDANGLVTASVTLTPTAVGVVTITATSVTNPSISASFTETAVAPVVVASLSKVLGDAQSAVVGTAFATPLEVQVATTSGSPANQTVVFSVRGPATLSSSTATTNGSGIAQVTATAGSTPGNVTVTASIGSASVTFNLIVEPQGPSLTASAFVNGADQQRGSISACSLATIAGSVAPALAGTVVAPVVGPLPAQLGNIAITFNGSNGAETAPILSASASAVTFLVPCDLGTGSVPVTLNSGGATTTVTVTLLPSSPGIFQAAQSDGVVRAVIVRPDGTFASPSNPARRGENVTAFFTGLGPVSPSVATNALPIPGSESTVTGQVIIGVNNSGVPVISAQLSATQPGVYMVTFQVPQDAPQGNSVQFSAGMIAPGSTTVQYSAGTVIPVE